MKFQKGQPRPPGAGRKIGSKNKITVAAKQAIHLALNSGKGAVHFLCKMKNSKISSDRAAFLHLVGKTIPREVDVDVTDIRPPPVVVQLPNNFRDARPGETVEGYTRRKDRDRRAP